MRRIAIRWATLMTGLFLVTGPALAAVQIKIATVAPEGSEWMQQFRAAAAEIKERTEGRVIVKFYTGGVMGNDKKVLRKIRNGQLQGGAFTVSGLSERYDDLVIYGLPLLFRNQAEVDYVREHMDPLLAKGLANAGFESFGFATGGFAVLMGNEPVTSLDQLRGRKAWIPEGDRISYAAMEAMDLSPVVLPITDVLTGLQTGLIEFIATPPVGAVVLQWHTKVKYITDVPLSYTLATLVVDRKAFRRMQSADQTVFREVMTRTYGQLDAQARQDNASALKALVASGLKINHLSAEQLARWRDAGQQATDRLVAEGIVSAEAYARLRGYLQEYRTQAAAAAAR